jgi:hypothetical protein
VRWVLSLQPLPADLVASRAQVTLPEVAEPLRLYEVQGALPRAFWTDRCEAVEAGRVVDRLETPGLDPRTVVLREGAALAPWCHAEPRGGTGAVTLERLDPHTVRLRVSGDPGFVVVLEGHHPDWHARGPDGEVPLLAANDRYWALHTPGGERLFTVRFDPSWVRPSLLTSALAGVLVILLAVPFGGHSRQDAGDGRGNRPLQ